MLTRAIVVGVLVGGAAASAQPVLQLGVRNAAVRVLGPSGAEAPFAGVNHTGAVLLATAIVGPVATFSDTFLLANGFGGGVTATYPTLGPAIVNVRIDLDQGRVTGGSVSLATSGSVAGDTYTAAIPANLSQPAVIANAGGGFGIQFATVGGQLSDSVFGNVPAEPWFFGQGGESIRGAVIVFRFNPPSTSADFDAYLIQPAQCYANCDGSSGAAVLTPADFTCFLGRYRAGDVNANCDSSTAAPALTPADFTCFLTKYRRGCGS
jgi:hypothetical protein